ncbi:hypothetical protein AMTRI_Chr01g127980 [Amborella trichopoda]
MIPKMVVMNCIMGMSWMPLEIKLKLSISIHYSTIIGVCLITGSRGFQLLLHFPFVKGNCNDVLEAAASHNFQNGVGLHVNGEAASSMLTHGSSAFGTRP